MKIAESALELVGHTPLVRLHKIAVLHGSENPVVAKLERFNPAGSAKDRVALRMIEDAERCGALKPGALIIEPTSGNTGVGLAMAAACKGYPLVLTMPASMSVERRALLTAMGAQIVLTDATLGMSGAVSEAEELMRQHPGAFMPSQFDNPSNPAAHETTAEEIWADTEGKVDVFVATVGTGGTACGTGRVLKSHKPGVRVVAVEPAESPLLSGGKAGPARHSGHRRELYPWQLRSVGCGRSDDGFHRRSLCLRQGAGAGRGTAVRHFLRRGAGGGG